MLNEGDVLTLYIKDEFFDKINDKGLEARLCENLNNKYSREEYEMYCKNMPFQKLSNKLKIYSELTEDGEETFFGRLKREYLKG